MYFNTAKALAVLAFTGTIASAAATQPDNIARRGDEKDANAIKDHKDDYNYGNGVDSKNDNNHGKYDKQDKLSHEEALKKHREEVEKQIKLNNEAAEKNKADVKVG